MLLTPVKDTEKNTFKKELIYSNDLFSSIDLSKPHFSKMELCNVNSFVSYNKYSFVPKDWL